jgi:hypothetical protein
MNALQGVRCLSPGLLAVWGLVVGFGLLVLEVHATRPGDAGSPSVRWPEETPVRRAANRSTLLIFLHPFCPCSRASVEEFRYILSKCGQRASAHALLLAPSHRPEGWGRSELEQDLAAIPDVHVLMDRGGAIAKRFGVETSGHVVLYDPQGRLTYSGGITAARGHGGDNHGRAAVIDRILAKEGRRSGSPVFGCPLTTTGQPVSAERRR